MKGFTAMTTNSKLKAAGDQPKICYSDTEKLKRKEPANRPKSSKKLKSNIQT